MLETQVRRFNLKDLVALDGAQGHKNARYMTAMQFKRLVENIKRDGSLTSTPLVVHEVGNEGINLVASGNHRVLAGMEAGITEADCVEIINPLSREQIVAIQLSHNAINGQDDPNTLLELYSCLDLSLKEYSGLTDDAFKVENIDIDALGIGNPCYEDLHILFLPEDAEIFVNVINKIKRSKKSVTYLAAHYQDYDEIFDAVVKVKNNLNIHNSAIAFRRMAELAEQRMEQISNEQNQ